ncbi:MAG: glycosyltransferase family A protein, partial [Maribacter sp.]
SIPSRLKTLHLTIRSLLNQDVRPEKIILWLHVDLKNELPKQLANLQNEIFEIKYSILTCSHRKLVHSLEKYPDEIIVTCDDDFMYRTNWLQNIYKEHLNHPDCITANQTRYIKYDSSGNPLPYKNWIYKGEKNFNPKAVIPIGAEGILYPPNTLSEKTTKSELYLELTPHADDLWFKAMAVLKNTNAVLAANRPKTPIPIIGSQRYSLKKTNIGADKNRTQWIAVTNYFDISPKTLQ